MTEPNNKRLRIEDESDKENDVQMIEITDPEFPPPRPPLSAIGPRTLVGRHTKHVAPPTSIDYWNERFPGFPSFVHEAFAAKSRGPECYEEFLSQIEKPGIPTAVCKETPDGEIVEEPHVVNWF